MMAKTGAITDTLETAWFSWTFYSRLAKSAKLEIIHFKQDLTLSSIDEKDWLRTNCLQRSQSEKAQIILARVSRFAGVSGCHFSPLSFSWSRDPLCLVPNMTVLVPCITNGIIPWYLMRWDNCQNNRNFSLNSGRYTEDCSLLRDARAVHGVDGVHYARSRCHVYWS